MNNELKKINYISVINNDIQYQDGIFEILEEINEIDFIILSQLIPGNMELSNLIEKINTINSKIKIILILEKYDENLEKILIKKGIYRIFYDNKVEIKDIIKIIKEDDKMEKYNEEIRKEIDELKEYIKNNEEYKNKYSKNQITNNKKCKDKKSENNKLNNEKINKNNISNLNIKKIYKKINYFLFFKFLNNNYLIDKNNLEKNKVISILGNNGSGKSIFSVLLANSYKKYFNKILIIDFDILNNSLHTILGVKKYPEKIKKIMSESNFSKNIQIEDLIINIDKNIDLISGINLIFDYNNKISEEKFKKILNKLIENYEKIIIDTTTECFFEYTREIIKNCDKSFFLTEANLLEISKSKRILEIYNNWNIPKSKINIIFNKYNKNSIDMKLLEKLFLDYKILGNIDLKKDYNSIINKNFKNINKKILIKKYNLISKKIC